MAKTSSRSLSSVGRSVARRVVGRGRSEGTEVAVAPAKKVSTKKVSTKTAPAKATKQAPAKKVPAKKAAAEKVPAKKVAAKKTPAKKTPAKKVSANATTLSPTQTRTAPVTTAAKKTPARATPAARKGSAGALVVRPGESAWTKDELAQVRAHLRDDVQRLGTELEVAEDDLHDLMRDAGDGAGHDQADVGSTTFERDQELMITNNAREMMEQSEHALVRISDGTFGVCEGCSEAIGKMRLIAFPRATLCLTCKQREERR